MPGWLTAALGRWGKYAELGAVSPDLSYLDFLRKEGKPWADYMHYRKTDGVIRHVAAAIPAMSGDERQKATAWLFGYTSHVIGDVTIHPVVERKVGKYEGNEVAHRNCEMHQDVFIFQRFQIGALDVAEYLTSGVGTCTGADGKLDDVIVKVWTDALKDVHPELYAQNPPQPKNWHSAFVSVVDAAEESRLFALARHCAPKLGLVYPPLDEVDKGFIENLQTPHGPMHYTEVFDRAIMNVRTAWGWLAAGIDGDTAQLSNFRPWNLDRGWVEGEEKLDMWGQA